MCKTRNKCLKQLSYFLSLAFWVLTVFRPSGLGLVRRERRGLLKRGFVLDIKIILYATGLAPYFSICWVLHIISELSDFLQMNLLHFRPVAWVRQSWYCLTVCQRGVPATSVNDYPVASCNQENLESSVPHCSWWKDKTVKYRRLHSLLSISDSRSTQTFRPTWWYVTGVWETCSNCTVDEIKKYEERFYTWLKHKQDNPTLRNLVTNL